jgi:hypothetical protein
MTRDTINVHIYNVPFSEKHRALACAEHFAKQYPDRVGVRNLCLYDCGLAVYRTKGDRIVVRGAKQSP